MRASRNPLSKPLACLRMPRSFMSSVQSGMCGDCLKKAAISLLDKLQSSLIEYVSSDDDENSLAGRTCISLPCRFLHWLAAKPRMQRFRAFYGGIDHEVSNHKPDFSLASGVIFHPFIRISLYFITMHQLMVLVIA